MHSKFSRIGAYIFSSPRQRSFARSARQSANRHREAQRWNEAAEGYAEYLKVFPGNFSIWVQLGHMYKEASRYDDADHAYSRAHALQPRDGDLLLNFGHLRKLQGRMEESAQFYMQSAKINGSASAMAELVSSPIAMSRPLVHSNVQYVRDAESEKALQNVMHGATLAQAPGFKRTNETHGFRLEGFDPQLHLELSADVCRAPVALLEISMRLLEPTRSRTGTLFLDFGKGFKPDHALRLSYAESDNGKFRLFLPAPSLLQGLRWDPVEGEEVEIALSSISATGLYDVDALMIAIQDATPAFSPYAPDEQMLRNAFGPYYAKKLSSPADRDAMDPLLPPWDKRAHNYRFWLSQYGQPDENDYLRMRGLISQMAWKPVFSFVMPTYNTPIPLLREIMDAMLGQVYPHFEICIADDCSSDPALLRTLEEYADRDNRVKLVQRARNGHISLASNSAANAATGDFIVLVDHDDLIPDYALYVASAYLNRFPDARILFSDEDKIDVDGERSNPYFKSGYNQFLMYGHNMVSHLGIYHRDLFMAVGGFRKGMEGSQDYDLFLRCAEQVNPHQIIHIPHVLYHWRQIPGSTAVSADQKDYAILAARAAITGHMERQAIPLCSVMGHAPGNSAVAVPGEKKTLVSIIIPTRNGIDLLDACLASIAKTSPENIEIVIVDNDSDDPAALAYLDDADRRFPSLNLRVLRAPGAFNFSAINNLAAAEARGEILCFLNNDTEITSVLWLDRARGLLSIPDTGIVGARLLYPDHTIQHFGIVTGMYDHRVAGGVHLFEHAQSYGYFSKHRMIGEFSAVTAACMFIRKDMFDHVGGFEPDLAVAYNDIDLCLKVRAAGKRVLCDPEIEVIHKESKSRGSDDSPEKTARLNREADWMKERWGTVLAEDPYYSPNLSLDRPDFALAYPPRQAWPWQLDWRDRPDVVSGRVARAPRFFKSGQQNDSGVLAICAILKNEAVNILEWIAYHHAVGVEKFYLYDNNSTDNVRELLSPLVTSGLVDLIPWNINPGQTQAYDDFADRHRYNWTWAAFIDLDEFINPFGCDNLTEWLNRFPQASAIALQWVNFGPNGHDYPPAGLMIEAYTTRLFDDHMVHGHVKTIVRMKDYDRAQSPHSFHVHGDVVDEHGAVIDTSVDYAIMPIRDHDTVCINHYYTRSRSEWVNKTNRGLADHALDTEVKRNPAWLDIYERDATVHDDRILKFSERTRTMLNTLNLPLGPQVQKAAHDE